MTESKYVGFITVRTSSSRLPNKCLLPLGDETVISHVVKRAINQGIEPIICTSTDKSDDILEEIASDLGVKVFRGSLVNKLKRWSDCAEHFNVNLFHTIDADDPLFDGKEMIASLELLNSKRLDVVCPTASSSAGGASVGYSLTADVVKRAVMNLECDTDTEMMWHYLDKLTDIKMEVLHDLYASDPLVRLTLDYGEDYWLLTSIVRILGNSADRHQIRNLLSNNPDFAHINLFRNDEWKSAQISKTV